MLIFWPFSSTITVFVLCSVSSTFLLYVEIAIEEPSMSIDSLAHSTLLRS